MDRFINRVIHGDCIEVMRGMPDGAVDMIFADPPYGHGNHVDDLNARLNDHRGIEGKPIANDTAEEFRAVMDGMLHGAARVLNKDCCCCCCCCCGGGPSPTFAWVAARMDACGLDFFHSVIWDKVNPGLGWRYRRQHEMVMVAHRTGGKLLWGDDGVAIPNVIRLSPPRFRSHPNEKPVSLVTQFIEAHTLPGQIILDPFCGSGTTLVAAKMLGRRYIGIDIEKKYCDITEERLRNTTPPLPFVNEKQEQGCLL
ncbi:MAG: DNA methyltransferase [Deltaproteobacteria bacterium]|nr:DNA methyltransferase [Deltaproteobacteria bacterium]